MIFVEISDRFAAQVESSFIERAVQTALAHLSVPEDTSLTIAITDDQQVQELNRKFRGVDNPTDVLSFPAGHVDPENGTTYLGDVIISYPQAVIQAKSRGHTPECELQLLVVHGTLHLLGHDHAEPAEKASMWAVQAEVLNQLGIRITVMDDA
jgi:probable rRNA maturation factor